MRGRRCLEVKVEPSDSVDLQKIYYTGFTRWCLNWTNRVRLYVCVWMAGVRDVYESDCGTIWVRDSKSNTCWGVSQSILSIYPYVSDSSLSTPLPTVRSLDIYLRAQPLNAFDNVSHQPSSLCLFHYMLYGIYIWKHPDSVMIFDGAVLLNNDKCIVNSQLHPAYSKQVLREQGVKVALLF